MELFFELEERERENNIQAGDVKRKNVVTIEKEEREREREEQ